jgi:hypothetical protein
VAGDLYAILFKNDAIFGTVQQSPQPFSHTAIMRTDCDDYCWEYNWDSQQRVNVPIGVACDLIDHWEQSVKQRAIHLGERGTLALEVSNEQRFDAQHCREEWVS